MSAEEERALANWKDQIKKVRQSLSKLYECKDRLDCVKSMAYALYSLQQSLRGWQAWLYSYETLSDFSYEELKQITAKLIEAVDHLLYVDEEATTLRYKQVLKQVYSSNTII